MNKIAVILLLLCSAAAFALKPPHPSSKHRPVVSEQRPQKVSCSAPIPKPQVTKTESLPLVALNDDVAWTSLRELQEINNPKEGEGYPWISGDGLRIYFTHGKESGNSIVFTQRASLEHPFSKPIALPFRFGGIISCWLTPDEKDIYISTRNAVYTAHRASNSTSFAEATPLSIEGLPTKHTGGVSFSADASEMFLMLSQDNLALGIAQCERTEKGSYRYVRTIKAPEGFYTGFGHLSKDGLSLYFSASYKGGSPVLYSLKRERLRDSFELQSFRRVGGLPKAIATRLNQPCVSDNLQWMVFVGGEVNRWDSNQLYLVQRIHDKPAYSPSTHTAPTDEVVATQQHQAAAAAIEPVPTPDQDIRIKIISHRVYVNTDDEEEEGEQNTQLHTSSDTPQRAFQLYPNPATEYITLSLNTKAENAVVEILSLEGKVLQRQLMNNNQLRLSVQGLNSGTYWLRLTTASGIQTQKFIRQ